MDDELDVFRENFADKEPPAVREQQSVVRSLLEARPYWGFYREMFVAPDDDAEMMLRAMLQAAEERLSNG